MYVKTDLSEWVVSYVIWFTQTQCFSYVTDVVDATQLGYSC